MEKSRIDRINELARKARESGLTPEEETERAKLRAEYLAAVRKNLEAQLDSTYIVDESGVKHKLKKKDE